ncbi:NAD(P)H-binding protein [Kitasatospora aburaviensis]
MHIGVIGATGTIGSRVVTEALDRGHRVTAMSRDASTAGSARAGRTSAGPASTSWTRRASPPSCPVWTC